MPCILYWIFGCQGAQASALVAAPPVPPLPLKTEAGPLAPRVRRVVELTGIEPATSALQGRRSPS